MKRIRIVTLLISVLIGAIGLASCATLGPVYQQTDNIPDHVGLVYIYRPSEFVGGGVSYTVKANGADVIKLYNGGYFPYFTKPGEIEFSAKTESTTSVTVDVKAGQEYYVKGDVGVGFFVGRPHLILVAPEVAKQEISGCKLIPEK